MHAARRLFIVRSLRAAAGTALLAAFGGPLAAPSAGAERPRARIHDFHDEWPPGGPFDGLPQALPDGTTHIGIHWRGEGRRVARVSVRTGDDGRHWSEWIELQIDDDPFDDDETFGALVDVRGARYVQYRVGLPGGRRLERVTLTTIGADAQGGPSAAVAGPSWSFTTLDGRARGVYTRDDWGCAESLGLKADGSRVWPAMFVPTKKLLVHHTATGNRYTDGAAEARAIYAYHAQTKGWGDIGYQALVDRFGNIYEGRRGRESSPREKLSSGVVAGHCYGHNYGASGLAVVGDFSKRRLDLRSANDKAMLGALEDLVVWECGRAGLPAEASSAFLKSDDTWHDNLPTISGHKDSEATVCPGSSLYSYVNSTLRQNAARRLAPFATPPVALAGPANRETAVPASPAFSWSGAARYRYRLEGWRKINTDDVEYWTPSGWTTTEPSGWTETAATTVSFAELQQGHYTFHVRAYDGDRLSAVESSNTVLAR